MCSNVGNLLDITKRVIRQPGYKFLSMTRPHFHFALKQLWFEYHSSQFTTPAFRSSVGGWELSVQGTQNIEMENLVRFWGFFVSHFFFFFVKEYNTTSPLNTTAFVFVCHLYVMHAHKQPLYCFYAWIFITTPIVIIPLDSIPTNTLYQY